MHVAFWLAFTWEVVKGVLIGAEPPVLPVRTRWRRLSEYLVGVLPDVAAALIVFDAIADPGAAPWAPLLAITVLGPIVLAWLRRGLGALSRRSWRGAALAAPGPGSGHLRSRGRAVCRAVRRPSDRLLPYQGLLNATRR
jgi:hypothetical protein